MKQQVRGYDNQRLSLEEQGGWHVKGRKEGRKKEIEKTIGQENTRERKNNMGPRNQSTPVEPWQTSNYKQSKTSGIVLSTIYLFMCTLSWQNRH